MARVCGNGNFVVIQGNFTNDIVIDGDGNTLTVTAEEGGGTVNFKTRVVEKEEKKETISKLRDKGNSSRVIKSKTADKKKGCCSGLNPTRELFNLVVRVYRGKKQSGKPTTAYIQQN